MDERVWSGSGLPLGASAVVREPRRLPVRSDLHEPRRLQRARPMRADERPADRWHLRGSRVGTAQCALRSVVHEFAGLCAVGINAQLVCRAVHTT